MVYASSKFHSWEAFINFDFFSPKLITGLIYYHLKQFFIEILGIPGPFGQRKYLTLKEIIHYGDYKEDWYKRDFGLNSAVLYAART